MLRVKLHSLDFETLAQLSTVWLAEGERAPVARSLLRAEPGRKGEVRLELDGLVTREDAEASRGQSLLVGAAELEVQAPDDFYDHQLVGCRVVDEREGEVGLVRRIWSTGAPDLLVVAAADGQEHLIPCAREIMREVDLPGGRIVIDAPPGLLGPF